MKAYQKWIGLGLIVVVVGLFGGCASVPMAPVASDQAAKQFASLPDKANVFIYRNETIGAAIKMGLYLNDVPLAQTAAKTYINLQLAPGQYKLRSHAENNSEIVLDVKAGEVYFVWQEVKMGVLSARCKLQLVDAEKGKKAVDECKLAATK